TVRGAIGHGPGPRPPTLCGSGGGGPASGVPTGPASGGPVGPGSVGPASAVVGVPTSPAPPRQPTAPMNRQASRRTARVISPPSPDPANGRHRPADGQGDGRGAGRASKRFVPPGLPPDGHWRIGSALPTLCAWPPRTT